MSVENQNKTILFSDFLEKLIPELREFATLLMNNEFTLYYSDFGKQNSFFSFSKGGFGYVQYTNYSGVTFSSEYIGGQSHGTGARYSEDNALLSLENAYGCLNHRIHYKDNVTFHTESSFLIGKRRKVVKEWGE